MIASAGQKCRQPSRCTCSVALDATRHTHSRSLGVSTDGLVSSRRNDRKREREGRGFAINRHPFCRIARNSNAQPLSSSSLLHANWQTSARGRLIAIDRRFLQITTRSSFDTVSRPLSFSPSLAFSLPLFVGTACNSEIDDNVCVDIKLNGRPFKHDRFLSLFLSLCFCFVFSKIKRTYCLLHGITLLAYLQASNNYVYVCQSDE